MHWVKYILGLGIMVTCQCTSVVSGQTTETDSLIHALQAQPADTHRVTMLNDLAERFQGSDYKLSLQYLNESIHLADSLDFKNGLADAKASFGELQLGLGALEVSMKSALESNAIYFELGNAKGMGRTYITVGLVQNQLRQYERSIAALNKAAACYASVKDVRGQISAQHNIGVALMNKKDTLASKLKYQENLQLLNGTEFWGIYAATYNNLGNIFDPVKAGDSAIYHYSIALEYKKKAKVPNKGSIGNTLMNIANVHVLRGDLAKANQYLAEAEPMIVSSGEKARLMQLYQLKGQMYYKMGRYKESAENFEQQAIVEDSMFTPQMAEQASRLEAAFQSENQKKEIELLNNAKTLDEIEKTRWRWIAGGVAIGLLWTIVLLIVVVLRGRERSRMLKTIQNRGDEIKRQQQEIVLQNEALSLQNKRLADLNQEKDGLIGIVAHDIRAPLNRSAALAELVQNLGNLSTEQERYLQMIKKVSNDGGKLIQDLLELNSYEQNAHRVELAAVDLLSLLDHSRHGFDNDAMQKGIEITMDAVSTIAKTDEKLLGRILDNLISNAVKFTPKGKKVHLSIRSEAQMQWIEIRDEGPGISAADQAKMFQKFQRLSARPTGGETSTGLGLSIVQALAERIGVELMFESTMGIGTTFKVGVRQAG